MCNFQTNQMFCMSSVLLMTKRDISRLANSEFVSLRAIYMKIKHKNYSSALNLYKTVPKLVMSKNKNCSLLILVHKGC
jgi:hypothetical protein